MLSFQKPAFEVAEGNSRQAREASNTRDGEGRFLHGHGSSDRKIMLTTAPKSGDRAFAGHKIGEKDRFGMLCKTGRPARFQPLKIDLCTGGLCRRDFCRSAEGHVPRGPVRTRRQKGRSSRQQLPRARGDDGEGEVRPNLESEVSRVA